KLAGGPETAGLRWYRPLKDKECTGLFRAFAALQATRDAVLEFTNRYGDLGIGDLVKELPGIYGEPLAAWQAHIKAMREAAQLWDSLRQGDAQALARSVRWQGKQVFVNEIPMHDAAPEAWIYFRPGDLVQPAQVRLQGIVNQYLGGLVAPFLVSDLEKGSLNL